MPDERLEQAVGRILKNIPIPAGQSTHLGMALTHRSWANEAVLQPGEKKPEANERLEFLGDSVLGLVMARELFRRMPEADEGKLSKAKARLVSGEVLAKQARRLELGAAALLGRGEEQSGGRERVSILANVLEAVIGVVYLETDLTNTEKFILDLWQGELEQEMAGTPEFDAKSRLQEYCQQMFGMLPVYRVDKILGPDHDRQYIIIVAIAGQDVGQGQGPSKKYAEQQAAAQAWETIHRPNFKLEP